VCRLLQDKLVCLVPLMNINHFCDLLSHFNTSVLHAFVMLGSFHFLTLSSSAALLLRRFVLFFFISMLCLSHRPIF